MELEAYIRAGLIGWYTFEPDSNILVIGEEDSLLVRGLRHLGLSFGLAGSIECQDISWLASRENLFDVIISVADLERTDKPQALLKAWRKVLKSDGKLLLGMNNRLGIRYFCGDRDPYTGQNFDSIEGYRWAYASKADCFLGRMYSREEIVCMLKEGGFLETHFMAVLADLEHPAMIFAEDYLPQEELLSRFFPFYNDPEGIFLEEEHLYKTLIENKLFHTMANAYLVECSPRELRTDVLQVTCSAERGAERGLYTLIRRSGIVEKKAITALGQISLANLRQNMDYLAKRNIPVVKSTLNDKTLSMPLLEGENGLIYLRRLAYENRERLLVELDRWRDMILASSEHITVDKGDGEGVILAKGYLDLVPINSIFTGEEFIFFDQEFVIDNYPANVILTRLVDFIYLSDRKLLEEFPREILLERYNLSKYQGRWRRMTHEFLEQLRNLVPLAKNYRPHQRDINQVFSNRQRINYNDDNYRRLFVDIFDKPEGRELFVFGSGIWAERFVDAYGREHKITAILDNNRSRQLGTLRDIPICSPEVLINKDPNSYKVIICIKGYKSVERQLRELGTEHYSIFDPGRNYPRKTHILKTTGITNSANGENMAKKPYKVGYVAGVFDLFHLGHLNILRRAKEQCEYLIVGVVSDEGVRRFKGVDPFIPFAERVEVVQGCRYVDEAVEIPLTYSGTRDAWNMYKFDVQFSGSDYINDPNWLAEKAFLEANGATMIFFPYTEQTSSTKIKALIAKEIDRE